MVAVLWAGTAGPTFAGRNSRRTRIEDQLTADRDYRIVISTDLEVGLKNVEFASGWRVAGDDLIVSLAVTNTGAEPLYLQAYVSAPGSSQHRRPYATLDAGRTAVRTFRREGESGRAHG